MIKFVISNKTRLLFLNRIPVLKQCFVFDFSKLNTIKDENFYDLVFSHIIVSNGLTKTTKSDRFRDLDEISVGLLKQAGGFSLHDIGVSNGVTSLELYNNIKRENLVGDFFISDKYAKIYYQGKWVKKFYDADGNLMSVNFFLCHFSPGIGKIFFLSRLLFNFFKKKVRLENKEFSEILLLAPRVYKNVVEGNLKLLDFDVFESRSERYFTFLRCMNVLMPAYFSTEKIGQGVNNLRLNLQEGGCLLLGRTDASGINHATFYFKKNGELEVNQRVNNGFDYKNPF